MKTLTKRYVTIAEAQKFGYTMTEYQQRTLTEKLEGLKEFAQFGKLVEAVHFIEYDNKTNFEHGTVFFEYKGYLLAAVKPYNKNMYRFYLEDSFKISNYKNHKEEPNQVGKPTEKKLNDWLNYLLAEEVEKKEIQKERDIKINAFRTKIENCGQPVRWSADKKRGYIDIDDRIEYAFEIQDSGYVSEQTRLRKNGLDTFLSLINNK